MLPSSISQEAVDEVDGPAGELHDIKDRETQEEEEEKDAFDDSPGGHQSLGRKHSNHYVSNLRKAVTNTSTYFVAGHPGTEKEQAGAVQGPDRNTNFQLRGGGLFILNYI